ncbi:MAG TPA: AraC family transcriptional regulator [Magnetospirillaceae bacterium]|nr:AraC family transcriptional regulator [Magnetospirillaceae bacterium]
MAEFSSRSLLSSPILSLHDVVCRGECRHRSDEECVGALHLVFPYRGVYVRHLGQKEVVAEANQVLFFNPEEAYSVSHPVTGGDACLSLTVEEALLRELVPAEQIGEGGTLSFRRSRQPIDPRAQLLMALLRHSLLRGVAEPLEAETLALTLVRRSLGERSGRKLATYGKQKLVDRAKLVLSSDLARRWSLAEIAAEVGVSPVYLTQAFQLVEGVPLYRYQLRLRLARALDLLDRYDDLTDLGLELGFSSHSHFTASFKQAYGRSPGEFRRETHLR